MEEQYVLSVLVKNSSGVLSRVSGLFSRRGYNIDSLTVGRTENKEISRMTITLNGDIDVLEQVVKQLNKLEDVIRVVNLKGTCTSTASGGIRNIQFIRHGLLL